MATETDAHAAPGGESPGKFGKFVSSRSFGLLAAALSFAVIAIYVFYFTPYEKFLFSDMKSFWDRAMARLNGDTFRDSQFIAWPPLYHIMLAESFGVMKALGLQSWIRLETPLLFNIFIYSLSVYAFQRVAVRWFQRPSLVLICVLLYAFGFPAWYFNAFLLSDNLGGPLFMIAISLVACKMPRGGILAAAVMFGLATLIRPSVGPYGLAFILFYLLRKGWGRAFLLRAAVFTAVYFAVVFAGMMEVSRISNGRVTGLSANGGLDFFIANSNYHRVDLTYDGWHFFVVVPAQSWKPENGIYFTHTPFYKQDYYFDRGWQAIERNPRQLLLNFGHIRNLFFADMLPSRYDAPGFVTFRPIWDWMKFLMVVPLGLLAWAWRGLGSRQAELGLFAGVLGLTMVVSYIFTGEPRYTYAIVGVIYLLFFKLVECVMGNWRAWLRPLAWYVLILALLVGAVLGIRAAIQPKYPLHVMLTTEPLPQEVAPAGTTLPSRQQHLISRIRFPYNRENPDLVQADNREVRFNRPLLMRMRTRMEILGDEPLPITFRAYSRWNFKLFVDGKQFTAAEDPDYFWPIQGFHALPPGMHDIELMVEYGAGEGGIALNYNYEETNDEDDSVYRERRAVGVDSSKVRFHLPADAPGAPTP